MFQVSEKVALVFGAVGGIGKCTVKELLDNNVKGIVLADLNDNALTEYVKLLNSIFGKNKSVSIKVDVTKLNEIKNAFDLALQTFSSLDIVVNCAGIPNENCYALNLSINLIGTTHIIHEAYNYLPKFKSANAEQAVIVNLASVAGLTPLVNFPAYSAAKAGIITFSYCIGKHKEMEGEFSVKILTLCPAGTETPMLNYGRNWMSKETKGEVKTTLERHFSENAKAQKPESVAKCILQIIRIGKNASCWLSKKDQDAKLIDYEALVAMASKMFSEAE